MKVEARQLRYHIDRFETANPLVDSCIIHCNVRYGPLPTKEVYYVHFTCVYFTFLFYITFIKTSKYS